MTRRQMRSSLTTTEQATSGRTNILIAAVAFFLLIGCRSHCAEEILRIDLGTNTGRATFRASGFLEGISASAPPQELVEPLKPRLFRALVQHVGLLDGPGIYERAKALGAKVHVDLSSCHGCPENGPCPGDNGDWTGWDGAVDYLIYARKQKGYKVEWDIWNEPNLTYFWPRSYEQYLELWARTVRKIRSDDPLTKIVGPGICGYDREWLQRFLLWAKSEGVLPDIICWHEFEDPRGIPARVAELRDFLGANGIPLRPISLNEIIGPLHQTKPGPTAMYLWAIEAAGVESAAHACWDDEEEGVTGCGSDSLNGLLVPATKEPRSVWWVYRRYADLTGTLVRVEQSESICGIAAVDSKKKQIGVLIGHNSQAKTDARLQFINLHRVGFLSDKVQVTVERIPDIGWRPLQEPEVVHQSVRVLFSNEITIPVPNIGPQDAFFVRLSPSEEPPSADPLVRNVRDYGAVGDGITDDTNAIQAAIASGYGVTYFPSGTYRVTRELKAWGMYGGTRLVGDYSGTRPTILLRANTPGYGDHNNPAYVIRFYENGPDNPYAWGSHTAWVNTFGSQLDGIDVVVENGNPGAIAVSHSGAQNSYIRNCSITLVDALIGIEFLPGDSVNENIKITGGRIGIKQGCYNWPVTVRGSEFRNQSVAAVQISGYGDGAGMVFEGCLFDGCYEGISIANGQSPNARIYAEDCVFRNITGSKAITGYQGNRHDTMVVLRNTYFHNVAHLTYWHDSSAANIPGRVGEWRRADYVTHGTRWENGAYAGSGVHSEVTDLDTVANPVDISRYRLHIPTKSECVNVRDFGAKGDGVTDDTLAIRAAIEQAAGPIWFPVGTYVVSDTIQLKKDTKLIGEHCRLTQIKLRPAEGDTSFHNYAYPKPIIDTVDDASGTAMFCRFAFAYHGDDPSTPHITEFNGMISIRWRVGRGSAIDDVFNFNYGPNQTGYAPLMIRDSGGGTIRQVTAPWDRCSGWGQLIVWYTSEPLSFYGMSLEHNMDKPMVYITNSRGIRFLQLQAEANQSVVKAIRCSALVFANVYYLMFEDGQPNAIELIDCNNVGIFCFWRYWLHQYQYSLIDRLGASAVYVPTSSYWGGMAAYRRTTPPSVPTTPTGSLDAASGKVTFSWAPPSEAYPRLDGYHCQIGTSPGSSNVFDGYVGSTRFYGFTATFSGTYYCRVRAKDTAGNTGDWTPSSQGVVVNLPPQTSAFPAGGTYISPVSVALAVNKPATTYYTVDGSEPTVGSPVYTGPIVLVADCVLKFFSIDSQGLAESPAKSESYTILNDSGLIADAKKLPDGAAVRLGNKVLHSSYGSFGYIQEPSRSSGIRLEGQIEAAGGSVVYLTGTMRTTAGGERYVLVDTLLTAGSTSVKPLGVNNRTVWSGQVDGLYVRTWGRITSVAPDGSWFVIDDGRGFPGIRVYSRIAQQRTVGDFAIVTGASGGGTAKTIFE